MSRDSHSGASSSYDETVWQRDHLFGPLEYFRLIREQIQHEDNLINHRLGWLMFLQPFLFMAHGLSFPQWLAPAVAVTAVFISAIALSSMVDALRSLRNLQTQWREKATRYGIGDEAFPQLSGEIDKGGKRRRSADPFVSRTNLAIIGIPTLVIVVWLFLLANAARTLLG